MEHYNVLIWGARQPAWSLDGVGALRLPTTHRYPISSGVSAHRRAAIAISVLLHIAVIGGSTLWLRPEILPTETEQAVEIVFQVPEARAPALPPAPSVAAAPPAIEPPTPRAVEAAPPTALVPPPPVEKAAAPPSLPAPPPPPPPPVEEAPALPPVPAPPPVPVERPSRAPAPPPKQRPVATRPHPRPTSRVQPQPEPKPTEATPQSAPPATPPAQAPAAPIAAAWRQAVAAWLAAHKQYPDEARRRDEQGVVMLHFTVDRSGHVIQVGVVRASGSSILDAAAEAMLRNATLPAFPPSMSQERIEVNVQVRYSLTQ